VTAQRFGAFCTVVDDRRRISFGPFTFAQMHVVDAAQLGDPAPESSPEGSNFSPCLSGLNTRKYGAAPVPHPETS
jgi:hypothetical protein